MPRPSLFEYAGGEPALLRLATAHHARCLADPVLEHPFSHGTRSDHVPRLAAYWTEVLGGPATFSASYGGHASVLAMHSGTGATHDLGDRFVAAFVAALDDAGLPTDPEFRTAMRAYIEWATTEVMSYAAPGVTPPANVPVPRWDWTGLQAGVPDLRQPPGPDPA